VETDHLRVKQALSWASVTGALDDVPALVAVTGGPKHELVYANDAYLAVFGSAAPDESRPGPYPELDGQGFYALLDGVYHSGQPSSLRAAPIRYATADGPRSGHFTFVYTPLRTDDHQVVGVLMMAVQVSADTGATGTDRGDRQTALTLQRSLLPRALHQPDELEVTVRYRPGPAESEVGGDWYDVVPLGAGRTGIVIGDVMGRGMHAAGVMGQLRAALRAYARLDLPPAEVLELLDGLVADLETSQVVTCGYAVFDPVESTVTYASAGHLPPFLIHPDGVVEQVDVEVGPPLGAEGGAFVEQVRSLDEGTFFALYTDGLIERHGHQRDGRMHQLANAFREEQGTLDERCEGVLARMGTGEDDVALLLVGRRDNGADPARIIELGLSEGREPTRRARAFCHGVLSTWQVSEHKQEDIVLVVSELVTNAILHGESAQQLRLRRTSRRVVVEVFDNGRRMPHPRVADVEAENGRGLYLVARLADRWGARPVHGGKVVWCEFDQPLVDAASPSGRPGDEFGRQPARQH
jgi:anti-sigma regulatory factor (Ser/Thr protein kinase)